jgi:hypothetical protein
MTNEEISTIKQTVAEESLEPIDPKEGDTLADLGESEGWKILMKKCNKKIVELLEPIQHEDIATVGDLSLIGAMAIARSEKIEVVRWLVSQVESEKNARRATLAKEKGESKPKE